ncbi:MAG: ATP-dependent DNA helicase, partial [Peptostreptococcaceae bacterium]
EDKFTNIKKSVGKKDKKINYTLKELEKYFKEKSKNFNNIDEDYIIKKEAPNELCSILSSFIKVVDDYFGRTNEENEELRDIYFEVRSFLGIDDLYNENYCTIYSQGFYGIKIKLYCVNPSKVIIDRINKSKSTTLFSATLIPMNYFKKMYGANEEDFTISLRSPFSTSNRLLMIGNNVQTTYNKRNKTSEDICSYIYNMIQAKKGNYMVFFPSYKYMELVYDKIKEIYPNMNISIQENNMSENDKEKFLRMFDSENDETHVGFCVLGGHFSEGIDLTKDKLIGVVIVGVGMPQIGVERDIIKDYMNEDGKGFDYAYVYPGMIKVLQAAGRCIRTVDDEGVILLLDERYNLYRYRSLFPYDWNESNITIRSSEELERICKSFWER